MATDFLLTMDEGEKKDKEGNTAGI